MEARLYAPATQRNRDPILAVLRAVLPKHGTVLEIASGSGEHALHFARHLPDLVFQPSDPDAQARASIDDWIAAEGGPNLRPALAIDAALPGWPLAHADAMLCINMIHISPWAATEGLFREASRLLAPGAPLYLYGPYLRQDVPLAPSNAAFDESLRQRNPAWGLRWLHEVAALATANGFAGPDIVEMPANNLSVVFRRAG